MCLYPIGIEFRMEICYRVVTLILFSHARAFYHYTLVTI